MMCLQVAALPRKNSQCRWCSVLWRSSHPVVFLLKTFIQEALNWIFLKLILALLQTNIYNNNTTKVLKLAFVCYCFYSVVNLIISLLGWKLSTQKGIVHRHSPTHIFWPFCSNSFAHPALAVLPVSSPIPPANLWARLLRPLRMRHKARCVELLPVLWELALLS